MNIWISVKDSLPERLEKCLCRVIIPESGGGYSIDYKILYMYKGSIDWNCSGVIVTHWMLIPNE